MTIPTALYGLTLSEAQSLVKSLGHPVYRAKQLVEWLYVKQIKEFSEAKTLPGALREELARKHSLQSLSLSEVSDAGDGESKKFLFKTGDGHLLETVLIAQQERHTVCVSTQLGCKIGCTFCASGKGRFVRNLTAGEIIEQIVMIQRETGPVTNIVYMGMGEPLDNFEEVLKSLDILTASWGLALGPRRITVSTSGITPKIIDFVQRTGGRVRLSISLHSSVDAKRSELVPINRKYHLKSLVRTLAELNAGLKRKLTLEYTLIKDENDSLEEAEGLAKIAKRLQALVNVIPYNPIREMRFETPPEPVLQDFCNRLMARGVKVVVRQTAGRKIDAACGQLRLDREGDRP